MVDISLNCRLPNYLISQWGSGKGKEKLQGFLGMFLISIS